MPCKCKDAKPAVSRWLGIDWIGPHPWPLRLWVMLRWRREWGEPPHPDDPDFWQGCGCSLRLKRYWHDLGEGVSGWDLPLILRDLRGWAVRVFR